MATEELEDSILKLTKKMVGVPPDYDAFDDEIMADINSVFFILFQLGVGDEPFEITSDEELWSEYLEDKPKNLAGIKTYMRHKVKLMFDPPTSSFLVELLERQCSEFESRVSYQVDPAENNGF